MFYQLKQNLETKWFSVQCRRVLSTPPLQIQKSEVLIVSMVSHRDLIMYLLAVKSLYYYLGSGEIAIINDGTLTPKDIGILRRHLSPIHIISTKDVEIRESLKGDRFSERLIFISESVKDRYVIQLDSDAIIKSDIPEVVECIRGNTSFVLGTFHGREIWSMQKACESMKDEKYNGDHHVQTEAEKNFYKVDGFNNLKYVRGCAGFSGYAKGSFSRATVEDFFQKMQGILDRKKWSEWGSEQVTSNYIIANSPGSRVLPWPKYCNYGEAGIFYQDSSFFHFTGPYRFANNFYMRAAKETIEKIKKRGKSMRIGVDARSLLCANPRGEGKALLRLYQEISSLRPEWEFIFYGQEKNRSVNGVANVSMNIFDVPGFRFDAWENLALPYNAWVDNVDILHCSGSSAPWVAPKPIIMTVHDVIPLIIDDPLLLPRRVSVFKKQLQNGLRNAKQIIAVSENTKSDIMRLFGTDPEKIRVVYWGCDKENNRDASVPKGLKKPYIMAFGGNLKRKNTDTVISAFAEIAKRNADIRFVLIGVTDTASSDRFKRSIQSCGIADRTELLGYIKEEDLDAIYWNTECLVYPSLYEGFGLPIIEAMSKGVPVVTSNISSLPEIAQKAALFIDPHDHRAIADAVLKVLSDSAISSKLKALGSQRAEAFSWEKTAKATIDIFEKPITDKKNEYDVVYVPLGAGGFYGAERSLLQLAHGVRDKGKRVLILAEEPLRKTSFPAAAAAAGLDIEWVGWSPERNNLATLFAAILVFYRLRAKAIHFNVSWRRGGWLVALIAKLLMRSKLIGTMRVMPDPHWAVPRRRHLGFIPGIQLWRLPEICLGWMWARIPDMTVAINGFDMPQRLVKDFGFEQKKIKVVYNGIPTTKGMVSETERLRSRTALGIDGAEILLCYSGRLTGEKGINILLRALTKLPPKYRLIIMGEGPERKPIQSLAVRLKIEKKVGFLGYVNNSDDVMASSDIVVVPSTWFEAFGRVVVEAMSRGVPVVASYVGGMAEIFTDGLEGIYVEPKDVDGLAKAIETLGSDPDRRRAMGIAGRKLVESKYSIERVVRQYLELYDELAAS